MHPAKVESKFSKCKFSKKIPFEKNIDCIALNDILIIECSGVDPGQFRHWYTDFRDIKFRYSKYSLP